MGRLACYEDLNRCPNAKREAVAESASLEARGPSVGDELYFEQMKGLV